MAYREPEHGPRTPGILPDPRDGQVDRVRSGFERRRKPITRVLLLRRSAVPRPRQVPLHDGGYPRGSHTFVSKYRTRVREPAGVAAEGNLGGEPFRPSTGRFHGCGMWSSPGPWCRPRRSGSRRPARGAGRGGIADVLANGTKGSANAGGSSPAYATSTSASATASDTASRETASNTNSSGRSYGRGTGRCRRVASPGTRARVRAGWPYRSQPGRRGQSPPSPRRVRDGVGLVPKFDARLLRAAVQADNRRAIGGSGDWLLERPWKQHTVGWVHRNKRLLGVRRVAASGALASVRRRRQ